VINKLAVDYPVSLLCNLLGVSRSSYYYATIRSDEREVRQAMEELAAKFPTYGSRRLAAHIRRDPYKMIVNRKRAQRIMQELGIKCHAKRRTAQTTNSRHSFPRYPNLVRDLEITFPDQVWVAAITHIKLREEFIYLAIIWMSTPALSVAGDSAWG
jgi:putative transposase